MTKETREKYIQRKKQTIFCILRLKKQPIYWTVLQAMNPNAKPL